MSKKSKYKFLLEKSISASLSAIEIYNKPDFKYREESFSILMVNAWETLLKAKILLDSGNDLKSLFVIDKNKVKVNGEPFIYPRFKINRAGNHLTIDIYQAIKVLTLEERLKENIELLVEIRDNAIHFYNTSKLFEKKVLEIGTASLRSYVEIVKEWFNYDLSQFNFYLMPISFFHPHELESFSIHSEDVQHKNLLNYIADKEDKFPSDLDEKHNISLILHTKFVRSNSIDAMNVRIDNANPKAIPVKITAEKHFANKYPWAYTENLLPQLKSRYSDFKINSDFHKLKNKLEEDEKFCAKRYLNANTKKGMKQKFYNPNILKEFDKHYSKK